MPRVMLTLCGPAALALAALALAACSDREDSTPNPSGALSACLDRPNALPRPPGDQLPCELIPPGLSLK